jgi:transposase
MTRAPKDPTRPLKRLVLASGKKLVLEITEETIALRIPKHRHAHVVLTYGQLETRAIMARPITRRRRSP